MDVYTDARLTRPMTGGGSHDWLYTATLGDAEALIREYNLTVKYPPIADPNGYTFAIV